MTTAGMKAWFAKSLFMILVGGTALIAVGGGIGFWHFSKSLPNIIKVEDYRPLGVSRVLGDNGSETALLAEFFKERRYLIPYEKMPKLAVQAFISAEDDQFFQHQGVNIASILRAAIANLKAGQVVQGGSTITQQVAKSLLLTPERNFTRKLKELVLAGRIESNLSKEQILYLYLNQIYLGHGAYGIEAAARAYYNKSAHEMTLAEAALLAGLPQAPGKYSPLLNAKRAKERQLYVLRRMAENKFISAEAMSEAAAQSLKIYDETENVGRYAPHLIEHVRRYVIDTYGEKSLYEDGLTIALPVSIASTIAAKESLQQGLRDVDKRQGWRGPVKKLKSPAEIEDFLKSQRQKLIHQRLKYTLFVPEGQVDQLEALKQSGIQGDWRLLNVNELYEGVVTSWDEKKRTAGVMIGAVRADLPFDLMRWAAPKGGIPITKGDLILVKVTRASESGVQVSLEQEPVVEGALVSIDVKSGALLAMEGGYDFSRSQFNRATQAQRQPGSAYKPIIYSAAIEKGWTPASIIVDSPIVYDDGDTGKWKPANFEEKFYGDTTLRQALIKSRNVPTIKLVQAIGIPYLIDFSRRMGMADGLPADLSISLGSMNVTLYDLTRTYAIFPRLGKVINNYAVSWIKDRDGKILEEAKSGSPAPNALTPTAIPSPYPSFAPSGEKPDQAIDPRVAFVTNHLMNEVVNYGTGHEAKQLGRMAAGKTGTTNDYIDAWFMGFTADVVTGVWVGYDSQKAIGPSETGARAALPIWLNFMREAVKAYPENDFPIPPGVVFASIDPATGKLAPANSSRAIKEAFIEGTQPTDQSSGASSGNQTPSDFLKEDSE